MVTGKISLRELVDGAGGVLTVPLYQRHYFWGEPRTDGAVDSATRMMRDLIDAYVDGEEIFMQSVTIAASERIEIGGRRANWRDNIKDSVDIVDGQQRLTFMKLLLSRLGREEAFTIDYACRPLAKAWMNGEKVSPSMSQDVHYFERTLKIINSSLSEVVIDRDRFADFVLDKVKFLCINAEKGVASITAYNMVNGTKSRLNQCDLIKARLLSLSGSDESDVVADTVRSRYAAEWENWTRWWNRADVSEYYRADWDVEGDALKNADIENGWGKSQPIDLLLRLCMRERDDADYATPLAYEEFRRVTEGKKNSASAQARKFFVRLRLAQKRFEDAMSAPETYNRVRAILLLQDGASRFAFMHDYFVTASVAMPSLEDIYKYSFLGMTYDEIGRKDSTMARFEELLASLSMADVYHTESKRDAMNLLLRLNIDEDIKLGRRFDFSIWGNRSLEHIYSKSKVWHRSADGRLLDGNDNELPMSERQLRADKSFMMRDSIVNRDGMPLSEHCIGNLVLLYGQNNAEFGNASFPQKKMMFLTPGGMGVFKSRNLLHSVCVFAGNEWRERQIVDNYNLTLKNLKLYYGYR